MNKHHPTPAGIFGTWNKGKVTLMLISHVDMITNPNNLEKIVKYQPVTLCTTGQPLAMQTPSIFTLA